MSEKSVNWERSCWKRLATWRRGRRRPWRLQPPAQPSTFRTCRTSFSVSYTKSWNAQRKEKKEKWIPLRNCINLLQHESNKLHSPTCQTIPLNFSFPITFLDVSLILPIYLVRLADASDCTTSNFTLHENRLHQSEEPGSKLLRLLRSSYQWSKKTGVYMTSHHEVNTMHSGGKSDPIDKPSKECFCTILLCFFRFQQLLVRCLMPTKISWINIGRRLHCAGSTTSSWWSLRVCRADGRKNTAENKISIINSTCF